MRKIRKNSLLIIFTSVLLLFQFFPIILGSQVSTVEWTRSFGGTDYDVATNIIQTKDNGYATVGITRSFGSGGQDFWLVKIDENGTLQWHKAYGGIGEDFAYSLIQTEDSNFVIAGSTTSFDSDGDYDFLLIHIDASGVVDWYKTYGTLGNDQATSLIKTIDGGYAIAGITNSSDNGDDFLLVKTDSKGDIRWSKSYGGDREEKVWSLLQTIDEGFVLAGSTTSYGIGAKDTWVVKTDEFGAEQWNRTYGGKDEDSAQTIQQTADDGFVLAGETKSYGIGHYDVWLVRIDENGVEQWNRTYGGKDEDSAQTIQQTADGGFVLGGYSENALYYDFLLIKTDSKGYIQWRETYHFGNDEKALSMIISDDGNYTLAGSTQSREGYDFLLMKTNNTNSSVDNLFPIANANIDTKCYKKENISFNGSGFDPDGEIISYKWDFNGDCIYDFQSNASGLTTHSYSENGTYYAYLEVTDNNGSKSIDMRTILVQSTAEEKPSDNLLLWGAIFFISIGLFLLLSLFYFYKKNNIEKKISKYFHFFLGINKWIQYLIVSFILITIVKIFFSLLFTTPYIYTDELNYGVMAKTIFNGNFMIMGRVPFFPVPTSAGYSYFLAPTYLLGNNMDVVYHGMLAINCILSSLLIFPVFFIMKYFVDNKYSYATSIIIAFLPTVLAHNYQIMSENAFYLIFLLSCFLLIKTCTIKDMNLRFIFYSLITGCSIGSLVMIRPTGVAMVASLVFVFMYKLVKNRKISTLKYGIVFLPFIPAILYLFLKENSMINDYPFSNHFDKLSLVFSNMSNLLRFIQITINEINYFILMSYIVFMVFVMYLILHWKKISNEKQKSLSILLVYSLFSIFFLIILTTNHIYWIPKYNIYSRYVSPGLPIIFMLGVIGMNLFCKTKNRKTTFQISALFVLFGLFVIFLFPTTGIKTVNNMDLIWMRTIQTYVLFGFNGFMLIQLVLGGLLIVFSYYLMFLWFFKKNFSPLLKKLLKPQLLIISMLILSLVIYYPSASLILDENRVATGRGFNEPARWLMQNDPTAVVVMEDSYGAFSGGGMDPAYWRFMYADMNFWFPQGSVIVVNKSQLSTLLSINIEIEIDYILSTHDLTKYYPSVEDFYIHVEPMKRQDFVDWHIYKIS